MTRRAARQIALAAAALALAPGGCLTQGPRNYENENDALRATVLELRTQVEDLTAERDELLSKLRETEAKPLEPQALEALPRVAGIRLDPLTGVDDDDTSPGMDRLIAYVEPFDGRRRFVQVAGSPPPSPTATTSPASTTPSRSRSTRPTPSSTAPWSSRPS